MNIPSDLQRDILIALEQSKKDMNQHFEEVVNDSMNLNNTMHMICSMANTIDVLSDTIKTIITHQDEPNKDIKHDT